MAAGRSTTKQSPEVAAVDAIFQALSPLDPETRARVLASAMSLLGMSAPSERTPAGPPPGGRSSTTPTTATSGTDRPLSPRELIHQKSPASNPQMIALFAYYREKVEGLSRFGKNDLRDYFGRAHEPPPGNYDRDFRKAVKMGWIHEDGDDSYLTSKGLEVVEAGFGGKQRPRGSTASGGRKRPARKGVKKPKASGRSKSRRRP
jgi:hypothetical protein